MRIARNCRKSGRVITSRKNKKFQCSSCWQRRVKNNVLRDNKRIGSILMEDKEWK